MLCIEGTYSTTAGATACVDCERGTYAAASGAISCNLCGSDSDSVSGSSDATACICNAGFSGPDGGPCSSCPSGEYKEVSGTHSCLPCPPGSYSVGGAALCTQCPFRTISPSRSQTILNCSCQIGYSGPDGSNQCDECLRGFFKPIAGSSLCLQCAAGQYSNETGMSRCLSCPYMQSSTAGSVSKSGERFF